MWKRKLSPFLILSLVAVLCIPTRVDGFSSLADVQIEQPESPVSGDYVKGQAIVTVVSTRDTALTKENTTPYEDISVEESWNFGDATFIASNSAQEEFLEDKDYRIALVSSSEYTTQELISKLRHKSYVVNVEPNYYQTTQSLSNDSYVEDQWYLSSPSTSIHAESTWSKASGNAPVVAVVDTGVNYNHEDLASRMWVNPYNAQGLPGTYGYDFGDSDMDPMDQDGHGTHCAGVIGAANQNAVGIAGITTNSKIMALKVFNSNDTSTTSYIIGAFNYISNAMNYGVNITAVNCSWGGGSTSSTLSNLINKIGSGGALFSFASGNDGANVEAGTLKMPYDLTSNYVIPVGAMTSTDAPAAYSDYGATKVTMFAPGDMILSTVSEDTLLPDIYSDSQRSEILSYYDNANDASRATNFYANQDISSSTYGVADSVAYTNKADSKNNGGSYTWTISNTSSAKRTVYFYVDVTDLHLSTNQTYYVSSMLGLYSGSQLEWEHTVMKSTSSLLDSGNRFVTRGSRTYLRVIGVALDAGKSQTLYVDEIGLTKANPDTTAFGKYDYYSGTSMAAPMVSGAIAALAEAYPNDTVLDRRARLLTCTRINPLLAGKCSTMSTLDLSKLEQYVAVSGISLKSSSSTCKVKKSVTARVTIAPANASNQAVTYAINNSSYGTIKQNGSFTAAAKGGGKTVTITATSVSNTNIKASVKVKISKQKITKLKINKKKLTLKVGKKKKLKVTVSPSYATNKKLTWTSSNKRYATVSSSGVVKARRAGKTVKITAKAKDGSRKKVICKVKLIR